jgi:hypothetical protein
VLSRSLQQKQCSVLPVPYRYSRFGTARPFLCFCCVEDVDLVLCLLCVV